MTAPLLAYVGLGSNLEDPRAQVARTFPELDALPETRCVARSSLYLSKPLGELPQPDYVNAVAALETRLSPHRLLAGLQALEQRRGRVRGGLRWGPRILDLDLLLYAGVVLDDPGLTLPHPGLSQRDFVLYPLQEIAPGLSIPGLGSLAELVAGCRPRGLVKLDQGPVITDHDPATP
ncbi:MAG TPA: 2-amino-4-hydroxy-6-hydroxymethyldihydropteridine diphosphokinase [Gammaproteobacteria bacterium]|nr:2-amino-4-hydroxy-6-hydroxymethyldihydropteridine diphosphokinase [Gammaproteobacteria bacterium]